MTSDNNTMSLVKSIIIAGQDLQKKKDVCEQPLVIQYFPDVVCKTIEDQRLNTNFQGISNELQ